MKKQILNTIGAATLAFGAMQGIASAQIVGQPCETCGVALGAPLPEGVFFVDLEDYGKRDGQANRLGVNVPITAWSTPFSFYNTRLEVLAAIPVFTHIDGPTLNRVDLYSQAILFAPRPRSSATASTPASSPARVARTTSPRPVAAPSPTSAARSAT